MKKLTFVLIITAFVIPLAAQSPAAVIREMTGTVEVKRAGSDNWAAARAGESIAASAAISTGFRSTAILAIGDSTLVVQPLTRLSIEELVNQNETETVTVNLSAGRIRADVKPPSGSRANFTVQSPSSVASVRGTSFDLDIFSIQVTEGAVSFMPFSGGFGVTVYAAQESWIDANTGRALRPVEAAETRYALPPMAGENQWSGSGELKRRLDGEYGSLDFGNITIGIK